MNFSTTYKNILESGGEFSITVDLDSAATQDVSVPLVLTGSATNGTDYIISTTTLIIPAGSTSNTFNINIQDDVLFESDEVIYIDLGEPTNAVLGSATRYTVNVEDNDLPVCEVGTHMLTVGPNSLNWSLTNEGEALIFTGGSVSWIDAGGNKPKLTEIRFSGSVVFSGREKPTSLSYSAWKPFVQLGTTNLLVNFDGTLGVGSHALVGQFQNASDGTTCSLTESFQTH